MNPTSSTPSSNVLPTVLTLVLALIVVSCGGSYSGSNGGTTPTTPTTPSATLSGIKVQASSPPSIAVGGTVHEVVTGEYHSGSDVSFKDVTPSSTWSTSDSAVATVDKGLVTGVGMGSAIITATFQGQVSTAQVVVGQTPSLAITILGSDDFSLSQAFKLFQLRASYPDGSTLNLTDFVTWSSSDLEVLRFEENWLYGPYEATLIATGTTTVTATLSTGEVTSIEVTVVP